MCLTRDIPGGHNLHSIDPSIIPVYYFACPLLGTSIIVRDLPTFIIITSCLPIPTLASFIYISHISSIFYSSTLLLFFSPLFFFSSLLSYHLTIDLLRYYSFACFALTTAAPLKSNFRRDGREATIQYNTIHYFNYHSEEKSNPFLEEVFRAYHTYQNIL
ncbi:hypothetical protein EYC80_000438 [Monilinia laxa]|uniref:Uncharacterized protein n=1 Tax=Monilinia laxa TaxID=61186 RepID=A0A5N6KAR5_MONLA|nr:hypothetical protein EYC80_000438 [Monilinia laxa]